MHLVSHALKSTTSPHAAIFEYIIFVGALEAAGMVGGLSALGAGLYNIGIPMNSIIEYEKALKSDRFLIITHGTAYEMAKAKGIRETTRPGQVAAHRS